MMLMEMVLMFMFLFSVMFITLLERKILGMLNYRKGPNFLMLNSLLQSLIDFLKLMTKKTVMMNFIMKYMWVMMIFFGVSSLLIMSLNYPLMNSSMYMYMNFFIFFFIYTLMAYFFLILSYASNSMFSMISMFRVLVQITSYEVGMMFSFMIILIMMNNLNYFLFYKDNYNILFMSTMMIYVIIIIMMSEMNRVPFDFLESETEIVSGFNVEYMASLFSFIFLVEYGFFLYTCMMLNFIIKLNFLYTLFIMMLLIWSRSFLPRYRYDKMMYFFWKDLVMLVLSMFLLMNIF